tara:strand:+ start:299 stop:1237 length:939 start_codon:yes stop_codon:yes gene_type:complete
MKKIQSIKIENSRKYFTLRLVAWLGLRSKLLTKIFSLLIGKKRNLPYDDVEAVYAHIDVEREAENIAFIRGIFREPHLSYMFDIGSNYMQFASSLSDTFKEIHCYDPNTTVLEKGLVEFGRANIFTHNSAIIPCNQKVKNCYFIDVKGNSGLSSVSFEKPKESTEHQVIKQIDSEHISEIFQQKSKLDLLKIDVEGLENELVRDAIEVSNFEGIICFESLSKKSRKEFQNIFLNLNYSFYIVKYNFSDYTGIMKNSFRGILKAIITNKSTMEVYKSTDVADFNFEFIPLVFCVPKSLEELVESRLDFIKGNL